MDSVLSFMVNVMGWMKLLDGQFHSGIVVGERQTFRERVGEDVLKAAVFWLCGGLPKLITTSSSRAILADRF